MHLKYKDRGGPAQLGIRDWAGLKGHGHDRNLACSLASEGRSESPRGRLGVTPAGTERQKVGFGRVRIGLIGTMDAIQLNAKKCHTKEGSMPVDIELVELIEVSCAFLTGVAVGVEVPDATVVYGIC